MIETDVLTGLCPKCGEPLEVPGHLKQFSCMYCGVRLSPAELRSEKPVAADDSIDAEACAAYYREHVLEAITNHPGIEKEMTRSGYTPAFERFTLANAEIFRQMDLAVSGGAMDLDAAVLSFLDQLDTHWTSTASWSKSRNTLLETDKFVIAIFLVPMIRSMKLPTGEAYCQKLQEEWVRRYPKFPFYLGTYEDMTGGFQKKFWGLCFITTAVCAYENKPDDCEELTAFRNFRDGYLRSCPDGPALIEEYYDIAPGIVVRLELSHDRDSRYAALRDQYLGPCYADIRAGRLAQCKERYVAMVRSLEKEFLS